MSQRSHLTEMRLISASVDASEIVFAAEAAGLIGIGYRGLVNSIERGKLPAFRLGRQWAILRSDVEQYRTKHKYTPRQPNRKVSSLPDMRTTKLAARANPTVSEVDATLDALTEQGLD